MRSNGQNQTIDNPLFATGFKFGGLALAITGAITIDRDAPPLQAFDPASASQNITLPAVEVGLLFALINSSTGTGNLVVKNASAATIGTVVPGAIALFLSTATAWYSLLDTDSNLGNAVVSTAASKKVIFGKTTVTGTANVTTGLTTVTSVIASLGADPSLNASVCSAKPGGVAGHIDLSVFMPTSNLDDTPIASVTATDIYWAAWGT